jgi:hypothetical protein
MEAQFMEKNPNYKPAYAEMDGPFYCTICNKTINLKKGDEIPMCCGRLMQPLD